MLLTPHGAFPFRKESSQTTTASEGVTVTASATPHAKGAWSQVVASTAQDAFGVWVGISSTASATAATAALADIGIGASGSEVVLIPDLQAGNATSWSNGFFGHGYFFPIRIPAGSRLSARAQALIASDTVGVMLYLLGGSRAPGYWCGSRVTAYGVDSANSRGVAYTPGSTSAWGSAVQLAASTQNRIRAMQIGISLGPDSTGSNLRHFVRVGVGSTPVWLVDDLPWGESTAAESSHFMPMNWLLSHMHVDIPAGTDLQAAGMNSGTGETRYITVYGVD